MPSKVAIFAFNGEPMCFVHALLNTLDMQAKGYDVKLIIEGSATRLVKHFMDPEVPFADLYTKVKDAGLIHCVCRACAAKMGSLEDAKALQMPLCREMSGHPSMASYLEQDYQIITL
jgi:hypothetical protein